MTLLVQKPSGAKLVMRQTWAPADTDAAAYIAAVEAADGQALEEKTRKAIDDFVLGCKADGIWSAIKASCILAGARTLSGALVPLVGTAPTNFNFVSGDYNRKTGILGNGSTKYLNSNRNNNADPQNNVHAAIWISSLCTIGSGFPFYFGVQRTSGSFDGRFIARAGGTYLGGAAAANDVGTLYTEVAGVVGLSRSNGASIRLRAGQNTITNSVASISPLSGNLLVFGKTSVPGGPGSFTNARLAFYSIGESLDLALLDTRVTQLITTFAAVIP